VDVGRERRSTVAISRGIGRAPPMICISSSSSVTAAASSVRLGDDLAALDDGNRSTKSLT